MKYTVTFSCGHEGEVNLYGKAAERDRRIAWYEKEGICPDCYRKMKEEERKQADEELAAYTEKIETELNLPELEGTEKQVTWARKIRAGYFKKLESKDSMLFRACLAVAQGRIEDALAARMSSSIYPTEGTREEIAEAGREKLRQYGGGRGDSAIFMKAFESVSAVWFIDNRDRL